jgi:hypothetical protein
VRLDPLTPFAFAVVGRIKPDMAKAGKGHLEMFGRQSSHDPITVHDIGGMNVHGEHEAFGIHQQMPLPAFNLLGPLIASLPAYPRRLHTLAVQEARTRLSLSPQRYTEVGTSLVVKPLPCPLLAPRAQVVISRFPGREVVQQAGPLAARPQHIEARIEEVAPGVLPWSTRWVRNWQQRGDDIPFIISQIRRIREAFHAVNLHIFP